MIRIYRNNVGKGLQVSKFFTLGEIKCKCGNCNITFIDGELLLLMDALRRSWRLPLVPTSVVRCDEYNRSLANSSKYSAHISGQAVDFPLPAIGDEEFISLCESIFPFTYVGEGFVHCALFNR